MFSILNRVKLLIITLTLFTVFCSLTHINADDKNGLIDSKYIYFKRTYSNSKLIDFNNNEYKLEQGGHFLSDSMDSKIYNDDGEELSSSHTGDGIKFKIYNKDEKLISKIIINKGYINIYNSKNKRIAYLKGKIPYIGNKYVYDNKGRKIYYVKETTTFSAKFTFKRIRKNDMPIEDLLYVVQYACYIKDTYYS